MPLYDFACPDDHVSEHLVGTDIRSLDCPDCGKEARRMISSFASRASGGFRTSTRTFLSHSDYRKFTKGKIHIGTVNQQIEAAKESFGKPEAPLDILPHFNPRECREMWATAQKTARGIVRVRS